MFNIVRKSRFEVPKLTLKEKNSLLQNFNQKHPVKVAEFSSLRKKENNLQENNEEIKINYIIEDTR